MPSLLHRNIRIHLCRLISIPTHSPQLKLIIPLYPLRSLLHPHCPLSPTPSLRVTLSLAAVARKLETLGELTVIPGTITDSAEKDNKCYDGDRNGNYHC